MGNMLVNSEDITRAMKISLDRKDRIKKQRQEKYQRITENKMVEAKTAYEKMKDQGNDKLSLKEWRAISMWVLAKENVPAPSKYNTKKLITDKLENIDWEKHFVTIDVAKNNGSMGIEKCSYPACVFMNKIPLVDCGNIECTCKLHHICQIDYDTDKFGGLCDENMGNGTKRCLECLIKETELYDISYLPCSN